MKIRRIRAENFKSFSDLDIELNDFNLLLGPNASGKSNFVEIFSFLRNLERLGLENAFSIEGGEEYFFNLSSESNEAKILIELEVDDDPKFWPLLRSTHLVRILSITYELEMSTVDGVPKFNKEVVDIDFLPHDLSPRNESFDFERTQPQTSANLLFSRSGNSVKTTVKPFPGLDIEDRNLDSPPFGGSRLGSWDSLLRSPNLFFLLDETIFSNFAIYDFDVKQIKTATKISGKAELEENGSNLPIVLRNILSDPKKKRQLTNFLRDALPFVQDVDVQTYVDRSLLFRLSETYNEKSYLPSPLLSDGTINIIALIVSLYFENKTVLFYEEPERNLHPALIRKVLTYMKDRSSGRQVFVSTHNPELIRGADVADLLFISRNYKGASVIERLSTRKDVAAFLENEVGIDELYSQNLL